MDSNAHIDLTAMTKRIVAYERAIRAYERQISQEAIDALAQGATYRAIGEALGITKQAAWERYGPTKTPAGLLQNLTKSDSAHWWDHPKVWADMPIDTP